ncbi:hypothetical protein D3C77_673990 [compost metagenome]
MNACRGHIRTGLHRRHRKILMKMNVHAVRFVDKHRHVKAMCQVHDLLQMSADAKVRRVNDQHRLGIRMALQRPPYGGSCNAVVDSEILVLSR